MQTNQAPQQVTNYQDDEIDLFELFQTLWQQKWLIVATTLLAPLLAYVFTVMLPLKKDYYEGRALIEIATISSQNEQGFQPIESPQDLSMLVQKTLNVNTTVPRTSHKLVEIVVKASTELEVANQLSQTVEWVLSRHQRLISNLSLIQVINHSNQVVEPTIELKSPKDKLKLILAVAFVLGGMLGVFIALIRSAIHKRRQSNLVSS